MLSSLRIKNYAIIRDAEIHFDHGLNVITGETGAGKSILMGALALILGERADTSVLLHGTDKCIVEGSFDVSEDGIQNFFSENELDYDDTCLIRREILLSGKSRAFVNDTPVNLGVLRELGNRLVDIVSQHQTRDLNENQFQVDVLDVIGEHDELIKNFQSRFRQWKKSDAARSALRERELKARKDEDYFRYVLNELADANLRAGEQEELENELERLSHASLIREATQQAFHNFEKDESGVLDHLREVKNALGSAAKHFHPLNDLIARIDSTLAELSDVSAELDAISNNSMADPALLSQTESRLQQIYNLQKKHHVQSIDELLALQEKLEHDISAIGTLSDEIEKMEKQSTAERDQCLSLAKVLSEKRKKAISKASSALSRLLPDVALPHAQISITQEQLDHTLINSNGIDRIEFLFSANKGFPFLPLDKVASGGELSRLMLCIKSLISDQVALPTIVFDEIDTGISGDAALKVARVMKTHATKHQVLAITHLPQIAAKADIHFNVFKSHEEEHSTTRITRLKQDERMREIAQMLSGSNPSEKVLAAAKELMQ